MLPVYTKPRILFQQPALAHLCS